MLKLNGNSIKKTAAWAFVVLMLLAVYMPILLLIVYSFISTRAGSFEGFTLSAYAEMFEDDELMAAVLNTFILAVGASLIATLLGTFTAIGMFNMRKRGRQAMGAANQITVVNADIVTAVAFSLLFITLMKVGLFIPEGWPTLMTAHVIITTPYVILTVLPRLRQLNPNVYEAALDLGAGPWKATTRVLMPQLTGAMIGGFALSFTLSLDDFVITKYTNGETVGTISTLLYERLTKGGISPSFRALSSIMFVVILAVLLAVNIRAARRKDKVKGKKFG